MALIDLLLFYLTKWICFLLNTGSVTGFIDLGDIDINTLNFEQKKISLHMHWCILSGVFFQT